MTNTGTSVKQRTFYGTKTGVNLVRVRQLSTASSRSDLKARCLLTGMRSSWRPETTSGTETRQISTCSCLSSPSSTGTSTKMHISDSWVSVHTPMVRDFLATSTTATTACIMRRLFNRTATYGKPTLPPFLLTVNVTERSRQTATSTS